MRTLISGRVQGVGYREWTRAIAAELGLDGWVRNRGDGKVEAMFSGAADAVDTMLSRCHQGPPSARVNSVEAEEAAEPEQGFRVFPTA